MLSIRQSVYLTLLFYIGSCVKAFSTNENHHQYGRLDSSEYDRPSATIDADVLDMVHKMTIAEKIGQMTQLNQDLVLGKDGVLNRTAVEYYAKNYYVGSYLNQLAKYDFIYRDKYKKLNTVYSNGVNYDAKNYAKLIEEIQEITLSVNSTFKIPIIYG
jgi:beta-glucosidase